jgi:hypothetical protein
MQGGDARTGARQGPRYLDIRFDFCAPLARFGSGAKALAAGSQDRQTGPSPARRPEAAGPTSHLFLKYFSVHCKMEKLHCALEKGAGAIPQAPIKPAQPVGRGRTPIVYNGTRF